MDLSSAIVVGAFLRFLVLVLRNKPTASDKVKGSSARTQHQPGEVREGRKRENRGSAVHSKMVLYTMCSGSDFCNSMHIKMVLNPI